MLPREEAAREASKKDATQSAPAAPRQKALRVAGARRAPGPNELGCPAGAAEAQPAATRHRLTCCGNSAAKGEASAPDATEVAGTFFLALQLALQLVVIHGAQEDGRRPAGLSRAERS